MKYYYSIKIYERSQCNNTVNVSQIKMSKRSLEVCEQVSLQLSFKGRHSF